MYKEPENINIKVYSPINIDSNDEKFFRNTGNVIPQIGYKVLDNVFIDEYGSVYNSEGQVVNCNFLAYKYFDRNIFSKSIQYEDELILIFYKWSVNNYFHWITESLPRVFNLPNEILQNVRILVPESDSINFITDSLNMLGLYSTSIIKKNHIMKVKKLIVPNFIHRMDYFNSKIILSIRNKLLNRNETKIIFDNICICRKNSMHRKVINELEYYSLLEQYGFKLINFEDYSLKEQISISHSAKIILGIHGAGLTNILFMQERSIVFELKRNLHKYPLSFDSIVNGTNSYFYLSNILKLNYFYQFCDLVKTIPKRNNNMCDFYIDLEKTKNNLNKVFDFYGKQN